MFFRSVMRQLPIAHQSKLSKEIIPLLTIALSAVIISSSMMLFIADRGNIISYTSEIIHNWKNPSYVEMQQFLSEDSTDQHLFIQGYYECKHFCFDIIRNARTKGYRCGYVTLSNPLGDDHAIVCFNTIDNGYVFVEPQLDMIISANELNQMLNKGMYSIAADGLSENKAMPLDNVHISWYMVI